MSCIFRLRLYNATSVCNPQFYFYLVRCALVPAYPTMLSGDWGIKCSRCCFSKFHIAATLVSLTLLSFLLWYFVPARCEDIVVYFKVAFEEEVQIPTTGWELVALGWFPSKSFPGSFLVLTSSHVANWLLQMWEKGMKIFPKLTWNMSLLYVMNAKKTSLFSNSF